MDRSNIEDANRIVLSGHFIRKSRAADLAISPVTVFVSAIKMTTESCGSIVKLGMLNCRRIGLAGSYVCWYWRGIIAVTPSLDARWQPVIPPLRRMGATT